ncbi:MAG: DNA methyltransferase [Nanoarchaeota archaeon]
MQYIFILGRNPELSKEEVFCYLKKEEFKVLSSGDFESAVLVDIDKELEAKAIDKLGGIIGIGKVLCKINVKELEAKKIYYGTENKIIYVIWNFAKNNSYNKVSDYLKKRFKEEKLKASEKPLTGYLELQDGNHVKISSGLIDEEYFVTDDYFGKIIERSDYKNLEERDMKKPERRESLAISPRLAKIMINLSMTKKGETLLDPFCGIGVILQEALLQGMNVVGVDKDERAISGARKNLEWKRFNKEDYKLINDDSSRLGQARAQAIATEPELGEKFKSLPSNEQINNIINNYEKLMFRVLSNLKNKVSGRIVFTAPLVKDHRKNRKGCDITTIAQRLNLRIVKNFPEFRENQIIGREIFILAKA